MSTHALSPVSRDGRPLTGQEYTGEDVERWVAYLEAHPDYDGFVPAYARTEPTS